MMFRRLFGYEDHELEDGGGARDEAGRQTPDSNVLPRDGFGMQLAEVLPDLLESFLRRVVREEVERIQARFFSSLKSATRHSLDQIDGSPTSRWQLQFKSKLPHTLFTGSRIETYQTSPVQLAIIDTFTNTIVTSGPLASLKLDVVAVDGDFRYDEQGDWTAEQFASCVLRQREGKPQLLTGDVTVTLDCGIGYLGDVYFTDNSSWIRSRKFRLGLRAHRCGSVAERVREGLSEPFVVKDHRGESYKKHHPPSPDDEVWRLQKIGKDGAFHRRLAENEIGSVRDFLRWLVIDQDGLRNILGSGMSNKIWEATVQHAWECEVDAKPCYFYAMEGHQVTLYFDSIYRLVGVDLLDRHYRSLCELSPRQKLLVEQQKELAYRDHSCMIEIGGLVSSQSSRLPEDACSSRSHGGCFDQQILQEPKHGIVEIGRKLELPEDPYELRQNVHMQQQHQINQGLHLISNLGSLGSDFQYTAEWDVGSHLERGNDANSIAGCCSSVSDFNGSRGLLHAPGSEHYAGTVRPLTAEVNGRVTRGRSKWMKLLSTVKFGMSIRKRVAAKRKARLAQVGFRMCSHLPNVYEGF